MNQNNIDLFLLEENHFFFQSLYDFYAHEALIEGETGSGRKAIIAFAIAETLRAILALSKEGDEKVFDFILSRLVPFETTTKTTMLEFTA